jgi:hypothetical protein
MARADEEAAEEADELEDGLEAEDGEAGVPADEALSEMTFEDAPEAKEPAATEEEPKG